MGVQQSQTADFHLKYNISPQLATSTQSQNQTTPKYIAAVLHLTEEANYAHLDSIIKLKMRSSSNYITKIFDKLESQSIKICSNQQRTTVVYLQTGINLAQLLQNRKKTKKIFTEEDVIYMIECVLRGIDEFHKIGDASQILTISSIILDGDSRFKVVDPFLIAEDPYTEKRNYNKQVQHIYALKNKEASEEIRKSQIKFKFFITQTQEKRVHNFYTSLFALACISLSMLDFEFNIQNYFNKSSFNYKNSWQFDWKKFRTALKRIRNQNLKQKIWLLSSEYHKERAQIYQYLNKNFEKQNYPIDLLLTNTTFSPDLFQDLNYKRDKFSLTRNQVALNQSIVIVPSDSHKMIIKQSDVKRPLTNTISSTNNSQTYTQPLANQQNSQTSHQTQSTAKIVFVNPTFMKRSLPASIISANNNPLYSPSPTFSYNPMPIQASQIIKVQDSRKNNQGYHFQILPPSIKSISSNHARQPSLQELLGHNSFINALQEQNLKAPDLQHVYHSQKRLKTLNDLHEDQQQSIPVDKQDDQMKSEHSENVERVDINQVFPGYHQNFDCTEQQLSPIGLNKGFSQPPLQEILLNGVIQEDSAENSLSQHSEVEIDGEFVVQQYTNGGRYQGYKKYDLRQGYGKLYFANGQIYDGEWNQNKMHGFGKLFYDENTLLYQGYWKDDYFNGNGKLFNLEVEPIKSPCDFLNLSVYSNNWKKYQGEFVEDVKQGKGRLTFQNDQFYEGEFRADRISGEGFFRGKNGCIIHGQWNDWKLVKIY